MIIRLKVFEQTLSIVDTKSVPRKGSKDYLVLQFMFSSDWKDLNKLCYLQKGEVSQPIDVINNLVKVPEWFTQQDHFYITLFGKNDNQEVPTNVVPLRLDKSNTLWEKDAPEPQPSWIVKLIDLNNHPPVPGENGYWMIWDTDSGAYIESDLPQSSVQPDWNQNDDTKPDYVKNRPFYTGDPAETVLVEESTATFTENNGLYMAEFQSTFSATVGEIYNVSWDGTVYECTCVAVSEMPFPLIGNLSILGAGSDTGEPFLIGVANGEGISILTADTSASHTFSIGWMVAQVAQIDPKYIHDMYYTEMLEESIEGIEIAGIPTNNDALDPNLPLEIGQIWNVGYETRSGDIYSDAFPNLEVHRAEDGTLYLGAYPDPVGYPFSITATRVRSMSSFVNNSNALSFILTGVSGAIHEEVVHEIPIKYLPNTLLSFKPAGKSYLTFSSLNSFTLKVNDKTKHWDGTLEYFASDKTWSIWDGTTVLSAVNNDGEYVLYLRGIGNTKIAGKFNYRWVLTGSDIKCIGNIENLLDYVTVESGEHPAMGEYCYSYMFSQCASLIQAPELPATTLSPYCYLYMFSGCTSLTQSPALPTTTLANGCYSNMFSGCTSLIQAPTLPATTLAKSCYDRMFDGCTSLTKAPVLPSTTLEGNCYYGMFSRCTSLIQAPALPATTLIGSCYYGMFSGCTSLTQVPALPATTLSSHCCNGMFSGCTKIKLSSTQSKEYAQEYRIPSSGEGVTATNSLVDMFKSTGGTFTGTPAINTIYYLSTDNMIVRETEVATLNGYVGSMIDDSVSNPLNITGATVGQIAKITAVDDSGKPTAWKAVDDRLPNVNTNDDGKALIVRQISEFDTAYVLEYIDSISLGIGGASPGQLAKVKYVDEFGKPIVWEAADMPSGGGAPFSFDLIVDHTVTAEDLSVSRLTWTNETIQDLGKYNLFYAVIESDTEFGITKWVKFYINNSPVSTFAGASSPKCKIIPATCNRFFGKWIGTSVYNPVNSVPFPVLVGPCESVYKEKDALKSAEDARSIAIGSYAADFGLAEGMRIKVYAMI